MKIYQIEILGSGEMSWYHSRVGVGYFAIWASAPGSEFKVLCESGSSDFLPGHYVALEHCRILGEFDGGYEPKASVTVYRDDGVEL